MLISVAICTWNRARLLSSTLAHMASTLRVPSAAQWELLVVDNACTDETDDVIASFGDRLPMRRLFEPRQGLAHARNRAVAEAAGDVVVWTDDDVLVDADWLEAYRDAFRRWPACDVFGGPIEPWFPAGCPEWLAEAWPLVRIAYAVLDPGPAPEAITLDLLPCGANMAVRAEALRRFTFDARLGHVGHTRGGGEETSVLRAMLNSGSTGRWVPGARVRHLVPEERQTVEYLRAYYRGRGRRVPFDDPLSVTRRRTASAWRLRALVGDVWYHLGRVGAPPSVWVRGLRSSSIAKGALESRGHAIPG